MAHGLRLETSKPATLNRFTDTALCVDLNPVTTDKLHAAMDWLRERQPRMEQQLARTHLGPEHNPENLALFDLASPWVTGTHNPWPCTGIPGTRNPAANS